VHAFFKKYHPFGVLKFHIYSFEVPELASNTKILVNTPNTFGTKSVPKYNGLLDLLKPSSFILILGTKFSSLDVRACPAHETRRGGKCIRRS